MDKDEFLRHGKYADFLQEKSIEYTRTDLGRISKYTLTLISGVVAIIGFLIANNKVFFLKKYIFLPSVVYLFFGIGIFTIVMEFANSYLFSSLTDEAFEIERSKMENNANTLQIHRKKISSLSKFVNLTRKITIGMAVFELILLIIITTSILNNIFL